MAATAVIVVAVFAIMGAPTTSSSGVVPPTVPHPVPSSVPAPTSTTAHGAVPAGVAPLAQLLPGDVDAATECSRNSSPPPLAGLTKALICAPKDLPGGQIFAFQFDSAADYIASLAVLNRFKGFDPATAGPACPPANAQGEIGWNNPSFPVQAGQSLECLSVGTGDTQPDYIWTYPTDNAVIDAQGAANSSFTDLDTWWTKDAPPPSRHLG